VKFEYGAHGTVPPPEVVPPLDPVVPLPVPPVVPCGAQLLAWAQLWADAKQFKTEQLGLSDWHCETQSPLPRQAATAALAQNCEQVAQLPPVDEVLPVDEEEMLPVVVPAVPLVVCPALPEMLLELPLLQPNAPTSQSIGVPRPRNLMYSSQMNPSAVARTSTPQMFFHVG
jgi:hypothetical protein